MPNIIKTTKGDPGKPLTDKQRRFVEEYVVDLNATAAAVRAGYSHRKSGLYTLTMGLPHVKRAVEEALAAKRAATAELARRVVEELAGVAFANAFDVIDLEDGIPRVNLERISREQARMLKGVEITYPLDPKGYARGTARVRLQMHDKVAALKELARLLGLDRGGLGCDLPFNNTT